MFCVVFMGFWTTSCGKSFIVRGCAACEFQGDQIDHCARSMGNRKEINLMLSWSIFMLIIALVAGVLGFTGIAGTAAWIAQTLFVIFLVLFLVSLLMGRRPSA
jgi:uncharacterized membrane protein YtjA (UPF0391 family)